MIHVKTASHHSLNQSAGSYIFKFFTYKRCYDYTQKKVTKYNWLSIMIIPIETRIWSLVLNSHAFFWLLISSESYVKQRGRESEEGRTREEREGGRTREEEGERMELTTCEL